MITIYGLGGQLKSMGIKELVRGCYRQRGGTCIKAQEGVPWPEGSLKIEGASLGIHTTSLCRQPTLITVNVSVWNGAPHPGVKLLTSSIKATAVGKNSSVKLWPPQSSSSGQRVNVPKSVP